ncbi:uncharacterized protein ATNIH1004_011636 [Aspergillus tanneri]|uniref:Uncharacterized protein n=1 Tax=Aspergillus tanneri TaxID=1220188 RepID=A0A5M9M7N1_9EURO|nr:uncharacterized protein ATNIH1004_011636 [Aspergillus tanneri]KAA8641500.1 hypothetical protein ATNIH1004_011636 [Aspergillus tanneri]
MRRKSGKDKYVRACRVSRHTYMAKAIDVKMHHRRRVTVVKADGWEFDLENPPARLVTNFLEIWVNYLTV